jgi:N-acetylmuramoyl-L-alanine amidase
MKIEELLIPVNEFSRPGKHLKSISGIVLHWVANPKSSALANRNFLETKQYGQHGYGSFHYIVDLNGSIIQCIPDEEMAYHCGSKTYTEYSQKKYGSYPNNCTIGIELCHSDWEGSFTDKTLKAAAELCSELCKKYMLSPCEDITTHHNIVGWKKCPKWFVDHPEDLQLFISEVIDLI